MNDGKNILKILVDDHAFNNTNSFQGFIDYTENNNADHASLLLAHCIVTGNLRWVNLPDTYNASEHAFTIGRMVEAMLPPRTEPGIDFNTIDDLDFDKTWNELVLGSTELELCVLSAELIDANKPRGLHNIATDRPEFNWVDHARCISDALLVIGREGLDEAELVDSVDIKFRGSGKNDFLDPEFGKTVDVVVLRPTTVSVLKTIMVDISEKVVDTPNRNKEDIAKLSGNVISYLLSMELNGYGGTVVFNNLPDWYSIKDNLHMISQFLYGTYAHNSPHKPSEKHGPYFTIGLVSREVFKDKHTGVIHMGYVVGYIANELLNNNHRIIDEINEIIPGYDWGKWKVDLYNLIDINTTKKYESVGANYVD